MSEAAAVDRQLAQAEAAAGLPAAGNLPISAPVWPENVAGLQESDLHRWISQLASAQKRWLQQADSLRALAAAARQNLQQNPQ